MLRGSAGRFPNFCQVMVHVKLKGGVATEADYLRPAQGTGPPRAHESVWPLNKTDATALAFSATRDPKLFQKPICYIRNGF